ncbi:glycosyltransferase [Sinomonas terrae]|uniref:Glycosyltransferase n=1 Tax=Sinomonas terrae TaxID=2908838 RepID=A0ABS9U032_9MICC|nr:glycosyltransferase [Sinomonas terrae]MCH6469675.1 glycosyltransferase [Sinomonas terrae]
MPSRPSVSVCMAAYNGADHIQEQLDSILAELAPGDEVIVVDDGSTDGTREILASLDDPRVRVVFNEKNLGYVRNFEKALHLSTGDVVMLSDQDDIWIPGRVETLLAGLEHADAAVGNCEHFGGTPGYFQRLRVDPRFSSRHARNLLGILIGYRLHWGSAMAFSRSLLDDALPFPAVMTESHDQWLAMLANVRRSVTYLAANTVRHRLHDDNLTPKKPRSVRKILRARGEFIAELAVAMARTRASSSSLTPRATSGAPHRTETAAVVSAYNPDDTLPTHVESLLSQVDNVVVVDDGSPLDVSTVLAKVETLGATVIRLEQNSGIAAALNAGIRRARQDWDPAWIMTMDQDSRLTADYVSKALASVIEAGVRPEFVGAVSPESHNRKPLPTLPVREHLEILDPMQSGTMYRAEAFDRVGYFDERLFIDCVDSDFNARLRNAGYRIAIGKDVDLIHSLGKSRPMRIFGWDAHLGTKKLFVYEHQPFRVYYITRNILTIAKRYALRQPGWVARRVLMEAESNAVRLVFGPRRLASVIAIARGATDFAAGRLGRIPERTARSLTAPPRTSSPSSGTEGSDL